MHLFVFVHEIFERCHVLEIIRVQQIVGLCLNYYVLFTLSLNNFNV